MRMKIRMYRARHLTREKEGKAVPDQEVMDCVLKGNHWVLEISLLEENTYHVEAIVSGIFIDAQMWYECCQTCFATYKLSSDNTCCLNCSAKNPPCISRMKLRLGASDKT